MQGELLFHFVSGPWGSGCYSSGQRTTWGSSRLEEDSRRIVQGLLSLLAGHCSRKDAMSKGPLSVTYPVGYMKDLRVFLYRGAIWELLLGTF